MGEPLSMPVRLEPMRRDGTPYRTHDRDLSTPELLEAHQVCAFYDPNNFGTICEDCGCCWCCESDCCLSREYECLIPECGCRAEFLAVQKVNAAAEMNPTQPDPER